VSPSGEFVALLLRREREREAIEQYIRGYREMRQTRETEEEIEAAVALSTVILANQEWHNTGP
jgi:hypothetical protein